jgi:hypothetical protein
MVQADAWYRYHPVSGPMREQLVAESTSNQRKLVSGAALLALDSGLIEVQYLPELKRLMRRVLRFHLGDKPLLSQTLFQ